MSGRRFPRATTSSRLVSFLILAILGLLGVTQQARAQFIGVDPYDPWNAMYRPFIFPSAPREGSAIPNQSRIGMMERNGGTFGGSDPFATGSIDAGRSFGGRFTPYYLRSHRYTEPESGGSGVGPGRGTGRERSHIANADDQFFAQQASREKRFFEALRERDPKRRAELLRAINQESRAATRSSASLRNQERTTLPESSLPAGDAGVTPAPDTTVAPGNDGGGTLKLPDPALQERQLRTSTLLRDLQRRGLISAPNTGASSNRVLTPQPAMPGATRADGIGTDRQGLSLPTPPIP